MTKHATGDGLLRFLLIFALVGCLAGFAYRRVPDAAVGVDDANIFLVYARNLAHGDGFVFNRGGERVEGFSSMAWVLVGAVAYVFHGSPERVLGLFSALLVSLALAGAVTSLDRCGAVSVAGAPPRRLRLSAGSLLLLAWALATPGYIVWTTLTLMETGLWSALLVTAPFLLVRASEAGPRRRAGLLGLTAWMPLLVLGRPEGMLWGLAFAAGYPLLLLARGLPWRVAARRAALPAAAFGTTWALLTGVRLAYFGFPFPNTYYAKIAPDRRYDLEQGWAYFREFLASHAWILPLLVLGLAAAGGAALWLAVRGRRASDEEAALPSLCTVTGAVVAIGVVVPILVGGDHFRLFRFYQPIWPLLVLPPFLGAAALARRLDLRRRLGALAYARYLGVALLALVLWRAQTPAWRGLSQGGIGHEFTLAREGREVGAFLTRLFADAARPSVAAVAVGGIQYAYEGPIVDLMGLNNVAMAHFPGDRRGLKNHAGFSREVFFRQRPDLVALLVSSDLPSVDFDRGHDVVRRVLGNRWVMLPVKGLYNDAEFVTQYRLAAMRRQDAAGAVRVLAFVRNDYLDILRRSGRYAIAVSAN